MQISFFSLSQAQTKEFGNRLARLVKAGDVLAFTGDLGAGKTTLTQGLAAGLKVTDRVISPTFNILKCYFTGTLPLYHIDAYRLEDGNKDIGLEEFIEGDGVAVIEWPSNINEYMPDQYLIIRIENHGDDKRLITIEAPDNGRYFDLLKAISEGLK